MKKIWILLLVVAIVGALLAVPGTALAKSGGGNGKPPKPPSGALYNVTLVGDLATTSECSGDDHLVMRGTLNGTTLNLVADGEEGTSIPRLGMDTGMMGQRRFPDMDVDFSGCHGGSPWAVSTGDYGTVIDHPGLLMISIKGNTFTFSVWHFDYWWETSVTHGKKTDIDVVEDFAMTADPITMDPWDEVNGISSGTVTGTFGIDHFLTDTHTGEYIPNEPVGFQGLTFTITIEEHLAP